MKLENRIGPVGRDANFLGKGMVIGHDKVRRLFALRPPLPGVRCLNLIAFHSQGGASL